LASKVGVESAGKVIFAVAREIKGNGLEIGSYGLASRLTDSVVRGDRYVWVKHGCTSTAGVGIGLNRARTMGPSGGGCERHEREGEGGEGFNAKDHVL
jgi:hypothetical protein